MGFPRRAFASCDIRVATNSRIFTQRERKWDARERTRHSAFDRERMRENALQRDEDALRVSTAQRLAEWDDEKEKERGKELFYVDRYAMPFC